jgi:predicted aspartyl protease
VTNKDFPLRGDEVKKHVANGASGPIYGYKSKVDYLQIGQFKLKDLETIITEDETGGDHTNQTIGLPLLMHFNIAFDYFDNVLYLAPNKHFKEHE